MEWSDTREKSTVLRVPLGAIASANSLQSGIAISSMPLPSSSSCFFTSGAHSEQILSWLHGTLQMLHINCTSLPTQGKERGGSKEFPF